MTTIPVNMTPVAAQPRPTSAAPSATLPVSTVDPMKLLNKHKWLLAITAVAVGVLGVGAHYLLATVYPQWRPSVLFNILPPQEYVGNTGFSTTNDIEMNRFMQTQVKVMTS